MSPLPYQYAVLRVVPRIDRGEFANVGVILYCQGLEYLDAAFRLPEPLLLALAPQLDLSAVRAATESLADACTEPVGAARENLGLAHRFGMLVAPRSTLVQPSPVHAGVTDDPVVSLQHLLTRFVG